MIFRESNDELVFENQIEEIVSNQSDKRNRAEEELVEDADSIVPKRSKIIVTQCEIIQNGNDTELIIEDNSMDINKSQVDDKYEEMEEEEETENALQEQDKQAVNKEQSQLNIDTNVTIENKECELAASLNINTEKEKQHEKSEDLMSYTDKENESVEKSSKISEKVQKSQADTNSESGDDISSENLFHEEEKSND